MNRIADCPRVFPSSIAMPIRHWRAHRARRHAARFLSTFTNRLKQ
jgi:hypothetical protein